MVNGDEVFADFRCCAELRAIPPVHAETSDVVADLQADFLPTGPQRPRVAGLTTADTATPTETMPCAG